MASPDKTPPRDKFRNSDRYVNNASFQNSGSETAQTGAVSPRLYLDDGDFQLYQGEALETLKQLPAGSVHCVVTSPPYWGLRDYGTGSWEGGNPDCDHMDTAFNAIPQNREGRETPGGRGGTFPTTERQFGEVCGKCGASRVDQALGLEATPELYVARMVEVFREVRRVLRGDGVCWVNLGDSYGTGSGPTSDKSTLAGNGHIGGGPKVKARPSVSPSGLKPKDLVGIPWRVAFALQADGWYLRSDVVWSKPNPMPESVTDRPTKAHEYVFLLTKSPRYFFDQEAVREPADPFSSGGRQAAARRGDNHYRKSGFKVDASDNGRYSEMQGAAKDLTGRNVRSVWEIATQPYPEAHFATYPEELVRRCILAGTSERGCCPECGAPWEREVTKELVGGHSVPNARAFVRDVGGDAKGGSYAGGSHVSGSYDVTTTGWKPSCECGRAGGNGRARLSEPESPPTTPCTVLDPFGGSGTTALVARKHGRHSILIELSVEYCELASRRLQQLSLLGGVGGG